MEIKQWQKSMMEIKKRRGKEKQQKHGNQWKKKQTIKEANDGNKQRRWK